MRRTIVLAVLLAFLSITSGVRAEDVDVPIEKRFSGGHGGVRTAGQQVINDSEAWKTLWKKIHRTRTPSPKLPDVDFSKQTVIAVFMGERTSGGYGIRVTSVTETAREIVVSIARRSPPPGAMTISVMTQPYDVVVVAKSEKPVRFGDRQRPPAGGAAFEVIEIRQSGGFAGVSNRCTIRGDGTFEFQRQRPPKTLKGKLPPENLAALSGAIAEQDWSAVPAKMITRRAADLFMYDITIRSGDKTHHVVCDDMSAPKVPALKAIVRAMVVTQSGRPPVR